MRLPRGVTGFRRSRRAPPLSKTDLRTFRGHCYAAARAEGGAVLGFAEPYQFTNNFAACTIELTSGSVDVLLNAHFPIIGVAEPRAVDRIEQRFVDAPALVAAFRSFGVYNVLHREALEQPLTAETIADLGKEDTGEFKYWKPRCVGDVVFNSWD